MAVRPAEGGQGSGLEVVLLLVAGQGAGRVAQGSEGGFPAGCQSEWRLYLPEQQNACGFLGPSSWWSLPSGRTSRDAVGKNPCIAHAHQI